jgi:hypothetical protein
MVRRAYLDVLGREPDRVGMREYTMRVMRDLRGSDEYWGRR